MKPQRSSANSTQSQVFPMGFTAPSLVMGGNSGAPSYSESGSEVARDPFADTGMSKHRFKSYRLKGEYEKPWLKDPAMKKTRWNNVIVGIFIFLGFAAGGVVCYFTAIPYVQEEHCLIYEDDFQNGLNKDIWSHEVQIDGFGTGSFDWTTTDERNSYVDEYGLHIVPTLTNETTSITNDQIYANYTLDLSEDDGDGTCTGSKNTSCTIRSDPVDGHLIPPVRSARISTKGAKSIRYGRVEVVAKLPRGDWLWPAIWMMPEDSVYGSWPRSGEIDIMESRGNGRDYPEGGRNYYYGTMHWAPTPATDAYWRTTSANKIRRGDYSDEFHTYGFQWTEKYLYFYVDTKIRQIFFMGFKSNKPLYELGEFSRQSDENANLLANPWSNSSTTAGNAPFDERFYLILNVAVGARNGWFL